MSLVLLAGYLTDEEAITGFQNKSVLPPSQIYVLRDVRRIQEKEVKPMLYGSKSSPWFP